ncbi:type II toxin-antitoxin system VapC family toxin [Solimonas soli]|uniref:type II toxin-antitoxin system VapC family toxin n=1 Tax=Solimonas soli TaxID=413479 RepID=UPI000489866E|nr:type II toxin-antitoxin system VapC family toxin [Solimonas soli]
MAKLSHLLDLPVIAELSRPNGNRRVFTLFQQRQALCALAAPASYALQRGIELMHAGERRQRLLDFVAELLRSGPPVLPFDGEAASWLARHEPERARRAWSLLDGQQAAIAATRELALVTRNASAFAGIAGLRVEDWFRP